ncbi:hypothetical protein VTK26DRAFT_5506 [Humicola hyalothermophila]
MASCGWPLSEAKSSLVSRLVCGVCCDPIACEAGAKGLMESLNSTPRQCGCSHARSCMIKGARSLSGICTGGREVKPRSAKRVHPSTRFPSLLTQLSYPEPGMRPQRRGGSVTGLLSAAGWSVPLQRDTAAGARSRATAQIETRYAIGRDEPLPCSRPAGDSRFNLLTVAAALDRVTFSVSQRSWTDDAGT